MGAKQIRINVNKELGQSVSKELNFDNSNVKFMNETEKYKHYLVQSGSYSFVVEY